MFLQDSESVSNFKFKYFENMTIRNGLLLAIVKNKSDAKHQKLYVQGISEAGGGQTYIISNEDDIPLAFGDALGGLFSIVAEDIDIIFRPQNGAFIKFLRTGGAVTTIDGGGTR